MTIKRARFVAVLIACALPWVVCTRADKSGEILLTTSEDVNGGQSAYYVTPDRLLHAPKWDPAKQIPLDLSGAVAIANRVVTEKYKSRLMGKAEVEGITLRRVAPSGAWEDSWFYMVEVDVFTAEVYKNRQPIEEVVILLDGTIVQPVAK